MAEPTKYLSQNNQGDYPLFSQNVNFNTVLYLYNKLLACETALAELSGEEVTIPDGSVTTQSFATDAKAPYATTADTSTSVAWTGVTGKPSSYPSTWTSVSGKPATFTPSTHTHPISQVVSLQETLDGKVASSSVSGVTPIADPATATAQDIATKLNELIAALQA